MLVKDVHDITISVFNRNQAKQDLQRHAIYLNDSDHNYNIEKYICRDKIGYERNMSVEDDK